MPLVSRLGAASSRGFGEFSQQAQGNYIENFFNTYLYNGNGTAQPVNTGVALETTASWSSYKISEGASYPYGVAVDSSGNFYVTGQATDGATYILLSKYDSSASLQWQRKLRIGTSIGKGVAVDSSGNVYVVGTITDGGTFSVVAKYNSSGAIQWQRKIKSTGLGSFQVAGVAVDTSSNVYITAKVDEGSYSAICILKYNTSGAIQWQRNLRQGIYSNAGNIAVDTSGNVYVAGSCYDPALGDYFIVAKYNTSGTIQWQRKLVDSNYSYGTGVAVDSSGNVYVTGYGNPGDPYILIAKYNTSGAIQWQRSLKQGSSRGGAITIDSSGNSYIAAQATVGTTYILVAKYNTSGAIQWQRRISQNISSGSGIALDTSGNLYVSGNAQDDSSVNYISVTKLSSDGASVSGNAIVSMFSGTATDSAGTTTEAAAGATDSAGTGVDLSGTATDSAGTTTTSFATQAATTSQGGLVWIKGRSGATDHALYDTNRGATFDLVSNTTAAQTTQTTGLNAFSASGFSIGSLAKINTSAATYASWTFRKQAKFFDVVTWTGTGTTGRSIPHNLGSAPGMMIFKKTSAIDSWFVYHRGTTSPNASWWQNYLVLNSSGASASDTTSLQQPTSTNIVLNDAYYNANGVTYVAYLFAHDAGGFGADGSQNVISCGSFVGTGGVSTINVGYEPQWLLFKDASSGTSNWTIVDNMRGWGVSSSATQWLLPNTSGAETNANYPKPTATGFEHAISAGNTCIYVTIRRGPMRTPTSGTSVYYPSATSATTGTTITTSFPVDLQIQKTRGTSDVWIWTDRLRGINTNSTDGSRPYLNSAATTAESNTTGMSTSYNNTGYTIGSAYSGVSMGYWNLLRAPGFFDEVCYTGTGSARTVSHNLGVVPELMIVKWRSGTTGENWGVYSSALGATKHLALNLTNAETTGSTSWNSTTPTSTVFSVGSGAQTNGSGATYVAYLFASCPGVSKVGSYTGTGATQTISCGFTGGARYVLIKRTDSTGSWWVWDTARGMVAGTDPRLAYNSSAAETNANWVYTTTGGFQIVSSDVSINGTADGVNWTAQTSGFGTSVLASVTYGNGLFVAVSQSTGGLLSTSPDGITWTSRTSGFGTSGIYAVTYGNSLYVAVGASGKMTTSSDGITWTSQTSGFGTSPIYGVAYGNSLYVAVGDSGALTTSTDAVTWTSRTSGTANSLLDAVYGNSLYVVVGIGGYLATSTNGTTWTSRTSQFGADGIYGVTYGNGLYVAVGDNGKISTSTDGTTWTARTSGFGTSTIFYVTYANGTFIAVGDAGKLATSTDGITWTARTSGFGTSPIYGATYGNGKAIIVGDAGKLSTNWANYIYLAIA